MMNITQSNTTIPTDTSASSHDYLVAIHDEYLYSLFPCYFFLIAFCVRKWTLDKYHPPIYKDDTLF